MSDRFLDLVARLIPPFSLLIERKVLCVFAVATLLLFLKLLSRHQPTKVWILFPILKAEREIFYMHPSKESFFLNFFVERFGARSGRKPRHHWSNKGSIVCPLKQQPIFY